MFNFVFSDNINQKGSPSKMEDWLTRGFCSKSTKKFHNFIKTHCKLIQWNNILNNKFQSDLKFYIYKDVVFDENLLNGHLKNRVTRIKDGIILSSFPKAGTTWLQEVSYLILDNEELLKSDNETPLNYQIPFLECLKSVRVEDINKMASPKLLKTHLPYSLLLEDYCDKTYKIIYMCRNPKDTVTSLYFFSKMSKLYQFTGTISEMVDLFINDLVIYSPFAKHVLEYWESSKTNDNILFLQYEDLQMDLKSGVEKISEFLGKSLNADQIDLLTSRWENVPMSDKENFNYSNGEGTSQDSIVSNLTIKVGEWKNHLSEEDNRKMDNWIDEHFKNLDLKFIYELPAA